MAILYADDPADAADWAKAIRALDPALDLRFWPDFGDAGEIDFVIVGSKAPGDLRQFANLRAIQSTWAGVNLLLGDDGLPPDRPLARMVDRGLTVSMTEYVVFHVLDHLRQGPRLRAAQREHRWIEVEERHPRSLSVCILGLGVLGADVAAKLHAMGFPLRGWSRSRKDLPGVASFAGRERLAACLAGVELLICLLPLTDDTRGILDRSVFAALAPGAVLIHAARGAHLVEADLLEALEAGRLSRAVIDVFAPEPLPAGHPFWRHPAVTVTPHVAAITRAGTGAEDIVANYRRAMAGQPLINQVDRHQGY
ncbi:MAG TPA: glyoxylate/hydroxypyruvate reductase A [Alphaproteobacteria bacterium]|nr:glyoxylate/hydroxypyruvate reductase A [Alphaproteobacteria bacterium]